MNQEKEPERWEAEFDKEFQPPEICFQECHPEDKQRLLAFIRRVREEAARQAHDATANVLAARIRADLYGIPELMGAPERVIDAIDAVIDRNRDLCKSDEPNQ